MKKKYFPLIIFAVILLIAGSLLVFRYYTSDRSYRLCGKKISLDTSRGMTSADRTADFAEMCAFLEENVPQLHDFDELYGIKYEDIRSRYEELIAEADSDFRYYTLIRGFLSNIPSAHMQTAFPGTGSSDRKADALLDLNGSYNNAQEYWRNALKSECEKHLGEEPQRFVFAYYNGEYRGISLTESDVFSADKGTLIAVNGVPADEFIKIYPLMSKLKYDHVNKKPFREAIEFNDICGDPCTVEYFTESGESRTAEMYCGTLSLAVSESYRQALGLVPAEEKAAEESSDEPVSYAAEEISWGEVYAFRDTENSVLYVRIDSFFYGNGYFASAVLQNSSMGLDNIIIDLRNNRGGQEYDALTALSALIPAGEGLETSTDIFITESRRRLEGRIFSSKRAGDGLYSYPYSASVESRGREKKKCALLVSDATISAADLFAAEFRNNGLGKIYGTNNTGGERDGLLKLDFTKRGGVAFYYTPYKNINPDGTSNSAYGTAPDVYLSSDIENYFIRKEIINSGEDAYSFRNRLKWDSALCEVMSYEL